MEFQRHEVPQPTFGTVNAYRVGDTLVDTGHTSATSRETLTAALDPTAVERVVLTHPHPDHAGGSKTVPELAATPHVVFEGSPEILRAYDDYLARVHEEMYTLGAGFGEAAVAAVAESYFARGEYAEEELDIDRVVGDGDTVRVGPHDCEVIHTPGHADEHMALFHADSGTVFSGDILASNGHFMHGPLTSDIGAYRRSLRRLRELDADRLAPGHGDIIDTPGDAIDDALTKADSVERDIETAVAAATDPTSAQTLAREVLDASDANVAFLTFVVCAYLDYLEGEGLVSVTMRDDGIYAE
jgi:glyoxylase-like metal-dependent hydrolase (beta-lactamase superfamily II)